jgi:phage repressor protein C with HTH and peptisase S24 domain
VIGKGQGGLPERIWTDGDFPVGASNEYAEVASADQQAFLVPVVGDSMSPRYQHGEFASSGARNGSRHRGRRSRASVTGETMLKRLVSRRAGYRFGSYNDPAVLSYAPEEVAWVYYVAHPVPARKIKHRV